MSNLFTGPFPNEPKLDKKNSERVSDLNTDQLPNDLNIRSVKKLTQSTCCNYGRLPYEPKLQLVKWLKQSVCFNYWSITN